MTTAMMCNPQRHVRPLSTRLGRWSRALELHVAPTARKRARFPA